VTLHWIQEPLEHFPDGRNTKFAYKTYFVEAAVKTLWYSIQDKGITPFKYFYFLLLAFEIFLIFLSFSILIFSPQLQGGGQNPPPPHG
jgi:hypothetical protein